MARRLQAQRAPGRAAQDLYGIDAASHIDTNRTPAATGRSVLDTGRTDASAASLGLRDEEQEEALRSIIEMEMQRRTLERLPCPPPSAPASVVQGDEHGWLMRGVVLAPHSEVTPYSLVVSGG